ncbi:DUF455 domain protein [Rhizophagus clarus]|uniref:DUF455 domain protein n=1 Tax=Rhizophagus clarus TaxID=94130 RepID=A0A8H3QF52_9GLOM|nr:DUF455 domain protein [Rhizophagus clarus]
MAKVQRLKPAHKIYERLIWDQDCISGANFVIGYEDRFLGIMEATREEFESEEIPFHRIRYFKDVETGQHIWDREKRIDLITRIRRRKKHRLRELSEARQRTEEEERIEAEHDQMYEDKMREVEERILRFQQFQIRILFSCNVNTFYFI